MAQKASAARLPEVVRAEFNKTITDVTAIRTTLAALVTAHNTLCTKLDSDGGVTDTNYSASAGNVTAPAALTATSVDWA